MSGRTDWAALTRLGLGRLGLRPAEFWALTPAELMAMLGTGGVPEPLGRAGFEALARCWPDKKEAGHA